MQSDEDTPSPHGEFAAEITALKAAIDREPDNADAYFQLGNALRRNGQFERAIECYRDCIARHPEHILALNNLGSVLGALGRLEESVEVFRQAVLAVPDRAVAHKNLGSVLLALRRFDEALEAFNTAVRLDPTYVEIWVAMAHVYKEIGQAEKTVECDRRAIALQPNLAVAADDLCYSIQYHPSADTETILRELSVWNTRHGAPLARYIRAHANDRNPNRRLRIGYISPNFRDHCQCLFMLPLLASHDPRQVRIVCYSDAPRADATTQKIQSLSHQWRVITGLPDDQVADLIRADGIDILVDLSMHMTRNRLRVFARKPAPVQITWLAYPGSTGMSAIDYRLSDPYLDPLPDSPEMDERLYAERTLRLPETFWCYHPLINDLPVNALPALSGHPFTFGCLNHFFKVNDHVLNLWSKVLGASLDSRIAILCDPGSQRQHVLDVLNIDPARVLFFARSPRREYLSLYHQIDLCLDTFPYNGHTTTLDALWMGVPTVNLLGRTIVGRAGLSQLSNIGLTELIARDEDQYIQIATDWKTNLPRLADLRATLRSRMTSSPLCDAPRFARSIEAAYRTAWQTWCGVD